MDNSQDTFCLTTTLRNRCHALQHISATLRNRCHALQHISATLRNRCHALQHISATLCNRCHALQHISATLRNRCHALQPISAAKEGWSYLTLKREELPVRSVNGVLSVVRPHHLQHHMEGKNMCCLLLRNVCMELSWSTSYR